MKEGDFLKKTHIIVLTILCCILLFSGCVKQSTEKLDMNCNELSLEQSNELLETIDWLPLGSVVRVDESEQKVMIIGRIQNDANNPENKFEYSAVLYPQGLYNPENNYLFNFNQIKQIYFLGYSSEDNKIWEKNMSEYVKENNIIFFDYEKMKEEQSENK